MPPFDRGDLVRRQIALHGDIARLREQAEDLSEVWTGLKIDGPDIVVLLTEPGRYEHRLRALVEHPDRLRVERSRYPRVRLDDVHRQAIELLGHDDWTSHGPGLERVTVTLRSNRTALAEQLHDRFGDAIAITLGRHRFPLDQAAVLQAPPRPRSTIDLPDVTFDVRLDDEAHPTGEDTRGHVIIRNDGLDHVQVETGRVAFGVLLDADDHVVGDWTGATTLPSHVVTLAPGTRMTRFFIAGSDTYESQLGASLPPGTYLLVVAIDLYEDGPEAGDDLPRQTDRRHRHRRHGRSATVVTDPTPIQLTAARADSTNRWAAHDRRCASGTTTPQ